MSQVHLFGEMDLDLSQPLEKVYKKAFHIAEACGYMVSHDENSIFIEGTDLEAVNICFNENGKAFKYRIVQQTDRTGELETISRNEVLVN